ncbi:MAG: DDE-type integrase/transposase/recombinase [Methanomassiliicoccaceae archaeon]|jgi:transposase|nr:DDE-type integrase/transposase/recombinase [Methanomassiliicoccaceae archaeon]
MTKSPKRRRAKRIEKRNEEFEKKRRENEYQKKRFLVSEMRAHGLSMRKIAVKIRMSVGFVHKWCVRLKVQTAARTKAIKKGRIMQYPEGKGIKDAIVSLSRAPNAPCRKITDEHVNAVKNVRKGMFTEKMGAQKIKVYAGMNISHTSINKILKDNGLTAKRKKRKQRSFDPFRRGYPNELWQIDYKEFGKGIYMLSVKDDNSSMILAADLRSSCKTDDVIEIMEKTVKQFGRPDQILSDHGTQWCSSKGDTCRFDEWCSSYGIDHIMGKVRKPTTQGKVERWHGSVLEEAYLPKKGSSVKEYRKAVLEYMEFYNNSRPHHGIGLQIPIMVYTGGLILPDVFTHIGVHEVP